MDGESHHGARNARISDDCKLSARSRICTDSLRCSMRMANCASFGQSLSSQSRKIGKIDNTNAIQTAARDLIGSSKAGSASARINTKKYPQRACQIVRAKVAQSKTTTKSGGGSLLVLLLLFVFNSPNQIKNGVTRRKYPHHRNQIGFAGETWASSPIVLAQFLKIVSGWKIESDGTRRSIKSAIVMMRTKQSLPARRDFVRSAFRFSSALTIVTSRNKMSDS